MAIHTLDAYSLECDKCNHQFEDGDFTIWADKGTMIESAYNSDWVHNNGKYYCDNCSDKYNITEEQD